SVVSLGAGFVLAADPSVTGKWATDTVIVAQQMKERLKSKQQVQTPDPFGPGGIGNSRGQRALGARTGQRARGGNNFVAQGTARAIAKPEQESETGPADAPTDAPPMAPAVIMDLKAEKDKLAGSIVVVSPDSPDDEKLKVEEGTVDGAKIKFKTYRKTSGNVSIGLVWEGEMNSAGRLTLTRKLPSGQAFDRTGPLVFTRVK
ncbi:MAG TPA: hypothetical protein VFY29_11105, partial [Terriglobia bacterium]|nr:hypothetical protein [Terriglobia bacterium]